MVKDVDSGPKLPHSWNRCKTSLCLSVFTVQGLEAGEDEALSTMAGP